MLWGVVQRFEDLSHLPSGSEVHPEARHDAAGSQGDHTAEMEHNGGHHAFLDRSQTTLLRCSIDGSVLLPKAPSVERLAALQTGGKVLEVIRELLVFAVLHNLVEVLHMLDYRVQLQRQRC